MNRGRGATTIGVVVALALGAVAVLVIRAAAQGDVLGAPVALVQPSPPAFDSYLKIDGIDGEATDAAHPNWIDVYSVHWGITGGLPVSRPRVDDFTISKGLDKSSPKLYQNCFNGHSIASMTLEQFSDGKKRMDIKLSNVTVAAVTASGAVNANAAPVEEVRFSPQKIDWTYYQYNAAGNLLGQVTASADFGA